MEFIFKENILLAFGYFIFLQLIHIHSQDLPLKFLIYRHCSMFLELDRNGRIYITFWDCMESKSAYNGNFTEDTKNNFSYNISKFTYMQVNANKKSIHHLCICYTRLNNASIQIGFMNFTLPKTDYGNLFCAKWFSGLLKTSQFLCHFKHPNTKIDIFYKYPFMLTGQRCLRIWHKLHPNLCTCLFCKHFNVIYQNRFLFDISALEDISRNKRDITMHFPVVLNVKFAHTKRPSTIVMPRSESSVPKIFQRRSYNSSQLPCPVGFYGKICDKLCHCKHSERCHNVTGVCKSKMCTMGYKGDQCNQSVCPLGYFGQTSENYCTQRCICWDKQDCHVLSGECQTHLCLNSSYILQCAEQICPRRYIKFPFCREKCHCSSDMICHPVTGVCPGHLCKEGYLPPACIRLRPKIFTTSKYIIFAIQLLVGFAKVVYFIYERFIPSLRLNF